MAGPNWFIGWPFEADVPLEPVPDRVRGFAPEDRHVTLAFLGPCGPDRAAAAWAIARACPIAKRTVTLGSLTLLGNPRQPSAIAALLDAGRAEVEAEMAAHRGALLAAAEARPDDRPPKAHVTLARIQRKASPVQRRQAADWAAAQRPRPGPGVGAELAALALYTWSEDRRTRLFRVVARQPLETG